MIDGAKGMLQVGEPNGVGLYNGKHDLQYCSLLNSEANTPFILDGFLWQYLHNPSSSNGQGC